MHGIVIGIGMNIASYSSNQEWVALQTFSSQALTIPTCQDKLEQELSGLFPFSSLGANPSLEQLEHVPAQLFGWNEVLSFEWKDGSIKRGFWESTQRGRPNSVDRWTPCRKDHFPCLCWRPSVGVAHATLISA